MIHRAFDESESHLLNVDLDIWSKRSLAPLVPAFGSKVFLLHEGWEDPLYGAHFEVTSLIAQEGAVSLIQQFLSMIEGLPKSARRLWNAAERREFNIGIQGSFKPHCRDWRLDSATLAAIARVKAGVVFSLYSTGKHFLGRPGEPPYEMDAGPGVGPTRAEALKVMQAVRKGAKK